MAMKRDDCDQVLKRSYDGDLLGGQGINDVYYTKTDVDADDLTGKLNGVENQSGGISEQHP